MSMTRQQGGSSWKERQVVARHYSALKCSILGVKSNNQEKVTDDVLQQCLSVFDLVFYIPLRHCKRNVTSVKDLVGRTVSEQVQNLLVRNNLHCLVILDGLDESPIKIRELPSMHGLANNVLFCTTRPWKLTQLQLKFRADDKVVQILGLLPSSEVQVIECVLVNFYKLKRETQEFKIAFENFLAMARSLASLVKIPMMLTACCCMWYEENNHSKQSSDRAAHTSAFFATEEISVTHTFLSLVDSMIRRADEKFDLKASLTQAHLSPQSKCSNVADQIFIYKTFSRCHFAFMQASVQWLGIWWDKVSISERWHRERNRSFCCADSIGDRYYQSI